MQRGVVDKFWYLNLVFSLSISKILFLGVWYNYRKTLKNGHNGGIVFIL